MIKLFYKPTAFWLIDKIFKLTYPKYYFDQTIKAKN